MKSCKDSLSLPAGLVGRLNSVCDRFEEQWIAGAEPRLEEFLPLVDEPDRRALLHELLLLELHYRGSRGQEPKPEQYQQRLPEFADVIAAAFAAATHANVKSIDSYLAILGPAREPGSLGSLDHYEVLEVVGRGGMGVVFKARDIKLQRIVAIKVLAAHLAADGTSRKRFVREAQAAAAVRDTHVVGIHAVNDEGAVPYLVMEFVGGVTLADQIKAKGPPTLKEILRIGMQAAEGLAAAHRQGLIHRDVKPANILLENGVQRVKITDFGLARAGDNSSLTQTGLIAGTPVYMSPEQARGDPVDQRSDLFSLGSVLYFVCTGATAFAAANTMAVLKRVGEDTPRPIRLINSEIPDWLAAIVNKLLEKDPKNRFQSSAEVAKLFGERLARVQDSGTATALAMTPAPRQKTSKTMAFVGVAILMIGVAGMAAFLAKFGLPPWEGKPPVAGNKSKLDPMVPPNPKLDPRVLTVSQKTEGGGHFRTINEALEKVEPEKKIIRVMDDAIYEEQVKIDRPDQFRGLVLEAAAGKKPTLRIPKDLHLKPPNSFCIEINGVANVTLRGLSIAAKETQVVVTGDSSGALLERLDLKGEGDFTFSCVEIHRLHLAAEDGPIRIQNCTLRHPGGWCINVQARINGSPFDRAVPCANVMICNNDFIKSSTAVALAGAPQGFLVTGNRIDDCNVGIDLREFLPGGAENVLVANNTLLRSKWPLQIWDEKNAGLASKNIRFQNNLVLSPLRKADLFFFDHKRGVFKDDETPGDIAGLLKAWRFSHNWREISGPNLKDVDAKFWIPGPRDTLQKEIVMLSRTSGNANFLRPPKNSDLGTKGAGNDDPALPLPAYVGAIPPEGVEAWDWSRTWAALVGKKQ